MERNWSACFLGHFYPPKDARGGLLRRCIRCGHVETEREAAVRKVVELLRDDELSGSGEEAD